MKKNEIKQSPFIPLCKWFCMVTRSFSCSGWSHSSQMEVNERTEKKKLIIGKKISKMPDNEDHFKVIMN